MDADRRSRAVERTALGWQRSALSLAVIAAVLLLNAVHRREAWGVAAAFVAGAGALSVGTQGRRLYRARLAGPRGPAARALLALSAVTLATAALAAAELLGAP